MSTDTPSDGSAPTRTAVVERYRGTSRVADEALQLVSDLGRDPVRAVGTVTDPIALREALSVLHGIVSSDLRYVPKDRTAYLAFQRMRKRSVAGSRVAAQQAYFDWLARNDPLAWFVLDPVVTVHPDGVLLEVFSKDEGTYAQLHVAKDALEIDGAWTCGTTNVDFSDALMDGVQRIRSSRPLRLEIGPEAVSLDPGEGDAVVEKQVPVPDSWLRGFLQVQSSATLARAVVRLAPVDLYNVLRQLRLNADQKGAGRAIRVELVPGEAPRLVLEPWEWVLQTDTPYTGTRPEVVRIWGRRRWMLLRRLVPFVESAELHLLGSGLPSFLVCRCGPITLTLGLTGFTASNWSRSLQFDTLLPRGGGDAKVQAAVMKALTKAWALPLTELASAAKAEPADVLRTLQAAGQDGLVAFDLAHDRVRLRPLTAEPLDPARLAFRNDRERQAHDLVAARAVKISKESVVHGTGVELVARVAVAAEKREYRPEFLLDDEGRVKKGACTCHRHRTVGLKEGPCAHLIALRLRYAELLESRAARRGSAITSETRTYARRTDAGEAVTQLSLDKRHLKVRWGPRTAARLRVQNLVFDTVEDAREAYLGRIERLEATGWLDASGT